MTVTVRVYVPWLAYVCDCAAGVEDVMIDVPSPKSHVYVTLAGR